jgi:hypothetical protein
MKKVLYLLLIAWMTTVHLPAAFAQIAAAGQITGTILDTSGAVVPDAKITVTNTQTGVQRETRSNATGNYGVPLLPVGVYDVEAQKEGFQVARKTGLTLDIDGVARADLVLTAGSTTSIVNVTASAAQLNTENAEVSDVISGGMISDLPLNGRNFTQLMVLNSSAYETFGSPIGMFRPTQGLEIGLAGGRVTSQAYEIDGMENRDLTFGEPIILPSLEAVQEFKMGTKTYSAEYGGMANQINLHFRSGTNALHGSAYEFLRNNALDARSFFDPPTIPKLEQNQFGYSLGGPVYIPKLYDGRNKSFFFANYEGTRHIQTSSPEYQIVPTLAQRAGQFTDPITDPLTGQLFPESQGIYQVPLNRFSQFAIEELKFAVTPNTNVSGYNWVGTSSLPADANQQNYKFDQNFGPRNSAFFRYSRSFSSLNQGGYDLSGNYGSTFCLVDTNQVQGAWTRTFSPTVVNQVTGGYSSMFLLDTAPTISMAEYNSFGLSGGFSTVAFPEIPQVGFVGNNLGSMGTYAWWPYPEEDSLLSVADSLSVIKGSHTLAIGGDFVHYNRLNGNAANWGSWTFNGQYSGDPFADFLLGNPSYVTIYAPTPLAQTVQQAIFIMPLDTFAAYFNDTWKVSRRLTVDLGLRYDFYQEAHEAKGRFFWFDYKIPGGGACTATKQAIAVGAGSDLLAYCGSEPAPNAKKPFAPRLALAFLPTHSDRTVIHVGYGIFYDGYEEQDAENEANHYPFIDFLSLTGTPGVNLLSTATPIPPITTIGPANASQVGGCCYAPIVKKNPYEQQWTFSVERKLALNTTLEVSYVGSDARHLPSRTNINQPTQYNPAHPLTVTARRPYQNIPSDVFDQETNFNSEYQAGNVKLEHRGRSLVLTAAYTYAHSLDDKSGAFGIANDIGGATGPMDNFNFRRDYGSSTFDITHRAVFSFVAPIPVGHGERFLAKLNRPADLLMGGWQINSIITLQTGFPFSAAGYDLGGLTGSYGDRADLVGNPNPPGFKKSYQEWFNPAAFNNAAPGFEGNSGRNILRTPGMKNWDLSLFKNITIGEHAKLQVRGEFFNAWNWTNFGYPYPYLGASMGSIYSAGPGRIVQVAAKVIF